MPPPASGTSSEEARSRVVWCGNLHDNVTEELLFELFLQAGPLSAVKIVQNKERGMNAGYAFITFKHAVSVPFAIKLLTGIRLYGRPLKLQTRNGSSATDLEPITPVSVKESGTAFRGSQTPDNVTLTHPQYQRCHSMPSLPGDLDRFRTGELLHTGGGALVRVGHIGGAGDHNQAPRNQAAPYTSRRSQFAATGAGGRDSTREAAQLEEMVSAQLQQLRYSPQPIFGNMMMMNGPGMPAFPANQMTFQEQQQQFLLHVQRQQQSQQHPQSQQHQEIQRSHQTQRHGDQYHPRDESSYRRRYNR